MKESTTERTMGSANWRKSTIQNRRTRTNFSDKRSLSSLPTSSWRKSNKQSKTWQTRLLWALDGACFSSMSSSGTQTTWKPILKILQPSWEKSNICRKDPRKWNLRTVLLAKVIEKWSITFVAMVIVLIAGRTIWRLKYLNPVTSSSTVSVAKHHCYTKLFRTYFTIESVSKLHISNWFVSNLLRLHLHTNSASIVRFS